MAAAAPSVQDGINYWNAQEASLDGVLGGFGSCSLPRIDALGSRQFLLSVKPELCTVSSPLRSFKSSESPNRRWRAVDVGAGIGRVTGDVLLHLVSDVVLLEPVTTFIQNAIQRGRDSSSLISVKQKWKGIADNSKSVVFLQGTLQEFDPSNINLRRSRFLERVGYTPPGSSLHTSDLDQGFDVVWCQWCLGHLSDPDLIEFLVRCKRSLRDNRAVIVVKENLCLGPDEGGELVVFDEQDSSLTRSDVAWKQLFQKAGLALVDERVQDGLPAGLYVVKAYALR